VKGLQAVIAEKDSEIAALKAWDFLLRGSEIEIMIGSLKVFCLKTWWIWVSI